MDFTIICPGCGSKLKLFDSQVKQKKGTIRCTRCGQRIKYDLTKPDPVRTGFWAETETPFKVGAQKRFLSIAKARQKNPKQDFPAPVMAPMAAAPEAPRIPPSFDRSHSQFQAFDMKTGMILGDTAKAAAVSTVPPSPHPVHTRPSPAPKIPRPAEPSTAPACTSNIPLTRRKAAQTRSAVQRTFRIPHTPSRKTLPTGSQSIFSKLRSFFTFLFAKK